MAWGKRFARALVTALVCALAVVGLEPPAHAGWELIVITGVHVGNPVMSTKDSCRGWVQHGVPVVPVTVKAAIFGDDPLGPYATATWSGGYGSWDDHFGTGVAHSHSQVFHMLLRADNSFHGQGEYTVQAHVQDVGLNMPPIASRAVDVSLPPVSPTVAKVKCTIAPPLGPEYIGDQIKDAALDKLKELACEVCVQAKGVYDTLQGYSDALDALLYDSIVDDPPDPDYQSLAAPMPPPVLPAPAGLTTAQQTAYTRLASQLATDVGIARALYATVNRVWGADNAAAGYWHRRQLTHLAGLTAQAATGLDALPPLWTAMASAFTLPDFTVGPGDVNRSMADLEQGLPAERADVLTRLGVSYTTQRKVAENRILYVDPLKVPVTTGHDALAGQNSAALADAMRTWRQWALAAAEDDPPVVTDVSPSTLSEGGGDQVVVSGANLAGVTGINFGPSTTTSGQGDALSCTDTACYVTAPPGHGTQDVVAVGPGGPSQLVPGDRVTYTEPDVPTVDHVFPAQGPMTGRTQVSVFGSGLAGGRVDFGPLVADSWRCRDTVCTATVPPSGSAGPVDVTVLNGRHRSAVAPGARFTYLTDAPPPPGPPTVTGISPAHGTHLGGEQVTITGTNFTGATDIEFGQDVEEFSVVDDTHIRVVTPSQAPGPVDVIVYGPGGASAVSAADRFTATSAAPTITSVSPASGPDIGGTEVTITGTDLTDGFVEMGDVMTGVNTCTPTRCTFTTGSLPEGDPLGGVHIQVWTLDGESAPTSADLFTFTRGPLPRIDSITPDSGSVAGGGTLVVSGRNLNGGTVSIGGEPADFADGGYSCSASACVVTLPEHAAGDVPIVVTTHAGRSPAGDVATYTYVNPPRPVVTGVSPDQNWKNSFDPVTIYGHHLAGGTVSFGGQEINGATCTRSECDIQYLPWPDQSGAVDVTVTTAGGTSATGPTSRYTYVVPTVTGISPASGWNDGTQPITITGTHLAGGSVRVGNNYTSETCAEDTSCVITAPRTSATGPVDVVVTAEDDYTPSVATPASRFTYTTRPLPTITSVVPDHGNDLGHETITVTGTALRDGNVTIGGRNPRSVSCSMNTCTLVTPSAAADGPVDVVATTSAGSSATGSAARFTYEPPGVPQITGVSPATGSSAGGTSVTLTGTDLAGTTIRFGTDQASGDCDRTTCTVTTPDHAAGQVDVTAQSSAGTSAMSADTHFSYVVPPAPTITALTPDSGPASGGVEVTLEGNHLTGGQVTVGGTAVSGETCTDTECTLTQPAGAVGGVPVLVTTVGGTSAPATFRDEPVTLSEHDIPGVSSATGGGEIIRGIDGDLWFDLPKQDALGRIRQDGTLVTYPTPAGSEPTGITYADGKMWFTERGTQRIGWMDGDGNVTDHSVPGSPDGLRFLTPGPDGRIWFAMTTAGAIGAMTTTGTVSTYSLPDPTVVPYHLLAGPDGRIWFTEWGGRSVGAITVDGDVTEYPVGAPDQLPWDLKTGPDGRLWFTEAVGQAVAAVDTATGEVTTYHLPPTVANPQGMVYGADGRFWFVTPDVDRVNAWDPVTDELTYYPLPGGGTRTPKYIAMDSSGDLWATEVNGSKLIHVTGIVSASSPTLSFVGPRYGGAGAQVTLTGTNLGSTSAVRFGDTPATDFSVVDPVHVTATVPPGSGAVDVHVTTAHGTSPSDPGAVFHYGSPPPPPPAIDSIDPPSGPTSGGTSVTVTGSHLSGASLAFGTTASDDASCSETACTATAPPGTQGTVDVVATTAAGDSPATAAARYTYLTPAPPAPVVASISPVSGPAAGGTTVSISGNYLDQGTVWFGEQPASATCTATSCTATSPGSATGPVHVRVVTAGGSSARTAADRFTYLDAGTESTTTTLAASPTSAAEGSEVTLTAHVSPSAATGSVTFSDAGTALGSADVSAGTATYTSSALTEGTHQITATYLGDATHAGSTSSPVAVTITAAPAKQDTTTALTAGPNHVQLGEPVTLTAHVSPSAASGTVRFADADGVLGQDTLVAGTATLTLPALSPGTHDITASYVGNQTYNPSSSGQVRVTVDAPPPPQATTTTLTAQPATVRVHQEITFTADVAPADASGEVHFLSGAVSLGHDALSAGTAVLRTDALAVGRHEVTAVYVGDDSHAASQSQVITVRVQPLPQVPGAPRRVTARAGAHRAVLHWRPPSYRGAAPIKHYVVLVYHGRHRPRKVATHGAVRRLTVKRLRPHVGYKFRVYAVNRFGSGTRSAYTRVVRPTR